IAATNRDLEAMVAAGRFRRDLYYRLNVFTVRLPPLRDRGDDLPLLVRHFTRRFGKELGKDVHEVPDETIGLLRHYPWPGNVRELQSVLKQATLTAAGPALQPEFLPATVRDGPAPAPPAALETWPGVAIFIRERLAAGTTDLYGEFLARAERQLFL